MIAAIILVFLIGYVFIALEHSFKIDKAASALITGILCWTIFMLFVQFDSHFVYKELQHHIVHIAEILFFLLGAMTIVELVDSR